MSNEKNRNIPHVISYLSGLIDDCEAYADQRKAEIDHILAYYEGKMDDLVPDEGRSRSVSRDVRTTIRKLMPSIMRTLLSNERIVDYRATRPEDEDAAQQATDYINQVIVRKSGARQAIYDAIFDALCLKTGILKWVAYRRQSSRVYEYTRQPESVLLDLGQQGTVTILAEHPHDPQVHASSSSDPLLPEKTFTFRLRTVTENVDIRLECIPRETFLIHPHASSIEDSPIVGERRIVTRSELISRGYHKSLVEPIPSYQRSQDLSLADSHSPYFPGQNDMLRPLDEILLYELYVKLDRDADGIAELYKVTLAHADPNSSDSYVILEIEPVNEAPYAEIVAEREAHSFEGHSIAEDVMDIQRVKTALLRETLDNIYWQNKKQPAIDPSKLTENGIDAVYNPAFGKPITLRPGANIHDAVQWMDVPFVADKSFAMMGYLDSEIRNRTGITETAGAVNPEILKDMTKFAAGLVAESGIAQAAMIVDVLSGNGAATGGIARAFQGILRLVIDHGTHPSLCRIRDQWVSYRPASWNCDMECVVNVGLGAGSKERDLAVLRMILDLQRELIALIGPNNPFVKPAQLYNVLEKITETAGFPSAAPYFSKPDIYTFSIHENPDHNSPGTYGLPTEIAIEHIRNQGKLQRERERILARMIANKAEMDHEAAIEIIKQEQDLQVALAKQQVDILKHLQKIHMDREKLYLNTAEKNPSWHTSRDP